MRILIVSAFYAPHQNPRAFRWTTLAERLARGGASVRVICGPGERAPRRERIEGVDVERVGHGRIPGFSAAPAGAGGGGGGPRPLLKRIARAAWTRIYWPDHLCLWFPDALAAAQRVVGRGEADALITVSLPFTSHLVGLALRRRGRRLRWVADVGDPFSIMEGSPLNNYGIFRGLNRRAEQGLLRCADAVAVTTDGLRREYLRRFPGCGDRIHVIPPVLSAPPAAPRPIQRDPAGPVRLVYIGTLYKSIRSPVRILELIDALRPRMSRKIEFHLFGSAHDALDQFERFRPLLGSTVFLHGPVDRSRALAEMASADVLVNIGNATAFQVPSKLVEYLHAGRPILNLCGSASDTSLEVLAGHPAVRHLFEDTPIPEAATADLVRFLEAPPGLDPSALRACLVRFEPDAVARGYRALLEGDGS